MASVRGGRGRAATPESVDPVDHEKPGPAASQKKTSHLIELVPSLSERFKGRATVEVEPSGRFPTNVANW
jgi:hypothetical protein